MAEMLHPTRKFQSACLQPFRFIALGDDDHRKLRMALESAMDRSFLDPSSEQLTPNGSEVSRQFCLAESISQEKPVFQLATQPRWTLPLVATLSPLG